MYRVEYSPEGVINARFCVVFCFIKIVFEQFVNSCFVCNKMYIRAIEIIYLSLWTPLVPIIIEYLNYLLFVQIIGFYLTRARKKNRKKPGQTLVNIPSGIQAFKWKIFTWELMNFHVRVKQLSREVFRTAVLPGAPSLLRIISCFGVNRGQNYIQNSINQNRSPAKTVISGTFRLLLGNIKHLIYIHIIHII